MFYYEFKCIITILMIYKKYSNTRNAVLFQLIAKSKVFFGCYAVFSASCAWKVSKVRSVVSSLMFLHGHI